VWKEGITTAVIPLPLQALLTHAHIACQCRPHHKSSSSMSIILKCIIIIIIIIH
jgi:hypothetical protein